jgi:hypothetical protein
MNNNFFAENICVILVLSTLSACLPPSSRTIRDKIGKGEYLTGPEQLALRKMNDRPLMIDAIKKRAINDVPAWNWLLDNLDAETCWLLRKDWNNLDFGDRQFICGTLVERSFASDNDKYARMFIELQLGSRDEQRLVEMSELLKEGEPVEIDAVLKYVVRGKEELRRELSKPASPEAKKFLAKRRALKSYIDQVLEVIRKSKSEDFAAGTQMNKETTQSKP